MMNNRYTVLSVRRGADDPKADEFGPMEWVVYRPGERHGPIVATYDTQAEADAEAARLNGEGG